MTHLEWLRAERKRLGTKTLAEALHVPAPSLRRVLSTGKLGRLGPKVQELRLEEPVELDEPDEPEDPGIELDESELDEYAELWGVSPSEAEDLLAVLDQDFDTMSLPDVSEYIDSLYDALEEQGWEGELSDLWDLYYGYSPGGSSFSS